MKNKKVYLIGSAIVALAVVIVALCILVPMASHRSQLKKLLAKLEAPERVTLGDPLFETGDILGNKGKEILLEGEARDAVLAYLRGLGASGYRTDGTERMSAGSLDLVIKVKTAEGEILHLWFDEDGFYYMEGIVAVLFEAEDEEAYEAFYGSLHRLLKEN